MTKLLDRLLLFVYSVVIGVASVVAIIAASGGFTEKWLNEVVSEFTGGARSVQASVIIGATILLLMSVRLFILSVRRGDGGTAPSINQRTDHGDIRISVETVENLALKAASRTRGVKDLRARVRVVESGLEILIKAFVDGEGSIPTLSEEIQRTVSQQIEEATGIPVSEVSIFIANVTQAPTTFKSRVE